MQKGRNPEVTLKRRMGAPTLFLAYWKACNQNTQTLDQSNDILSPSDFHLKALQVLAHNV